MIFRSGDVGHGCRSAARSLTQHHPPKELNPIVTRIRNRRTATLAAVAVTASIALAGCAESSDEGSSGGGDGLPAGSSMEDYQAAFADIDPITFNTQSPSPKGSATGKNIEDYLAAITEWSDGKIAFEVAYSNAVAEPTEIDDALNDGRLDLGQVLPIYEPAEYPANAALIEGGFISDQSSVVGALQSNAWPNQVAFDNDEIMAEYDEHGLVPLVPVYNSGANGFFCSQERRDLASIKGASTGSGGTGQSKQVEALGGSAASVPYTELFESLQRGVVDCTVSSPTVGVLGGFVSEAPHVVIDPDAGFSLAPGAMAFSKAIWEEQPLVVQQLFWDKLDVFIGGNITSKIWPNNAEAAKIAKANGGSIEVFEDDARSALQDANEGLLDDLRATPAVSDGDALVDSMESAADTWLGIVSDDLGFSDEVGYNDFDTWYTEDAVDITPYTERLLDEVFSSHRPS